MPEITPKSLSELWNKEKEYYRTAEVGTGVQKFCKKVFSCAEMFNLTEGFGSTNEINRSNEFLEETKKKGRRADVVVFIDSDIIVPCEIERYGNIKAGEKQLLNYQADWVKKYGILTDGNEWRFYLDKFIEKTFFIDKILDDPTDFLTYWNEYVTPENYYRSSFDKKGQLDLFDEVPHLDEVRGDFFRDITRLIESFKNKLNLKGYFTDVKDDREREKKAVEITYAYLIQFILYKTLVDNGFADFQGDWEVRVKEVRKALESESYGEILQRIKGISKKISENIYKRFSDEQEIINKHLEELLAQPKNTINDVSVWLDILLFVNRYNFINVKNEIFGYVYENYLKDLYADETKRGQYFTDPLVVDFMLDQIGYDSKNLKKRYAHNKDSLSIIDPSSGSGTFLYNATHRLVGAFFDDSEKASKLVEQLVNDNVFGLDIAEFPLYLAEMNILMRMLPLVVNQKYNNPIDQKIKVFKTRDSIAEFLDTAARKTEVVTAGKEHSGQISMFDDVLDLGYESYMRDKRDLNDLKSSLETKNGIPRYRFDYVIGNPPYVSYNEISKQELLSIKLLQEHKMQMSDVYGVNLNTVPGRVKAYAPKPNLYSFFVALGIALLKDAGKMCYIIPQTILSATDLDVLRYHLAKFLTIEKIFTFSGKMFVGRGIEQNKPIPTSSLIFLISKTSPGESHRVEVFNYLDSGDDIDVCLKNLKNGKNTSKVIVDQSVLLERLENWNFLKFSDEDNKIFQEYNTRESFDIYRFSQYSQPRFGADFFFDKGLVYPKDKIVSSSTGKSSFELIATNQKGYLLKTNDQYIPKSEIRLPKGAQGFKVYDAKYKIIWRYMNTERFIFADKPVMMNHNWVLISSDKKSEMLYIFSLLNSSVSSYILWKLLSNDNEKSFQIGIKTIKEFCRVPKITDENKYVKTEIVKESSRLLELEASQMADHVSFDGILQQKFDSLVVKDQKLFIHYKNDSVHAGIKDNPTLVAEVLAEHMDSFLDDDGVGSVHELKKSAVVDFRLQEEIKSYIDDLVFALYFNVKLSEIGFQKRESVHKTCKKHKYYDIINNQDND